jgi:hypothetical protein
MMFDNTIEPAEPRRRPATTQAHTDAIARQHNLYTTQIQTFGGAAKVYYADYQQKSEVMRAHETRISTKLDDRQTVSAMMDLAEARGWDRLTLRGTQSFKREAWVQAQVRGVEVDGYKPKDTDMQEAARRKAAAAPVKEAPAREAKAKPAAVDAPKVKPKADTQREKEKAVWNVVETAGKHAREQEAVKPAAKQTEKPPSSAEAA